jgi:4a-hydroxytetrahydrobiopterin dehydratase
MSDLADKECVPCKGGVPPLRGAELHRFAERVDGWSVVAEHHVEKQCRFKDFVTALAFVNTIGAMAEQQGHHPDLFLGWGRVGVKIWTHKIDGLTESDFVLAAKVDRAFAQRA